MKHSSNFRHDINGLRAIAVLVVVMFHFRIPGFEAGYLGVDIFFVISGFLMAAIISRGLSNEDVFSHLAIFYIARAKRIMPALIVMVPVMVIVGWWALGPTDYEQLATHARSAVTFLSNYSFYNEAGYFDIASHEKWLLHTWSLSVEWQFYLLLPLLMMVTAKVLPGRHWLIFVVTTTFFASFFYSVYSTGQSPDGAFYLLPSRAWELLAGVIVYLVSDKVNLNQASQRFSEYSGLMLIALSLVIFDGSTPWPSMAAALPVLGTALVLLATRETPKWATPSPIQWLGRSSYSLYLWHWPAYVSLVYLDYQDKPIAVIVLLIASLVLSAFSYHFVEQPSRRYLTHLGSLKAISCLIFLVIVIVMASFLIKKYDGFESRMPDKFNAIMA